MILGHIYMVLWMCCLDQNERVFRRCDTYSHENILLDCNLFWTVLLEVNIGKDDEKLTQ
jgi:hypothetical protein